MGRKTITLAAIAIVLTMVISQTTIFVVQPVGIISEGKTMVMLAMDRTRFIDSADAVCAREMNDSGLLCRGLVITAVVNTGTVLLELPYSELLYDISTIGEVWKN